MQDPECYYDTGKVTVLLQLLERYFNEGRKVLLFSQVSSDSAEDSLSPSNFVI